MRFTQTKMGFERKRRGRGRDKRDTFGDESYDGYREAPSYDSGSNNSRHPSFDRDSGGDSRGGYSSPRPSGGGMPAQVVGSGKGTVKFFNASKGFGFVACEDRPDDVFVHISAVEQAGLEGLGEGQELEFTLVDRGGKVSASDLVIVGDVVPFTSAPKPRDDAPGGGAQRQLTGENATGSVKFFNSMKGFGFVARDDGESDVFVHISSLEKSGISTVNEGDRLKFDIEIDRRGKFSAVNLSMLDE